MTGEPVTQGQFFERMNQSDEKYLEAHRRLRESIDATRQALEAKLDEHTRDDRVVADDVLVLMNERDAAKNQAISRSTVITLFIAAPSAILSVWLLVRALHG
jgi:hypothetical protein